MKPLQVRNRHFPLEFCLLPFLAVAYSCSRCDVLPVALDNESESIVQAALDKLMASKDRTIVVIAHRVRIRIVASLYTRSYCGRLNQSFGFLPLQLSTIRNADRIAFISDGRVKEIGCVVRNRWPCCFNFEKVC